MDFSSNHTRTNIASIYNISENSRIHGIVRIVVTSTCETNGTAQLIPINEENPLGTQSPYSSTKIAVKQNALSYFCPVDFPV
ncbi:GDP-mannose 4,6-dehydratase [Candidatus Pelagisphaera phototrophica]|uniref:GDP-mannose 4,6-dehydratase n=1 Tax=Candidatus Pelagisphaera phototrophica TaxID=2684113 RepID=UPI003CCDDBBD